MLIDCDTCRMRNTSTCDECVVPLMLGITPVEIDETERRALANLAEVGLCPPLRLVPVEPEPRHRAGA